jgi:hypothetical protein
LVIRLSNVHCLQYLPITVFTECSVVTVSWKLNKKSLIVEDFPSVCTVLTILIIINTSTKENPWLKPYIPHYSRQLKDMSKGNKRLESFYGSFALKVSGMRQL